jgi:hypothetical protein
MQGVLLVRRGAPPGTSLSIPTLEGLVAIVDRGDDAGRPRPRRAPPVAGSAEESAVSAGDAALAVERSRFP